MPRPMLSAEPGAGLAADHLPYRMALAGGWIDQPFVSRCNPSPPGSIVTVALKPTTRFMDRCGMGTSTRRVAARLWGDRIPGGECMALVRELYQAENTGRPEPSGSQDMVGLVYPGVNRLDYDAGVESGIYPARIASCQDPGVARWIEQVLHFLPVAPRPDGYNPLGIKNLDPAWIERLGNTGKDCYAALLARDLEKLGKTMNACMACWEAILPQTVVHPALAVDLKTILAEYQSRYPGAMYSGCGGGYLIIAADTPVPGTFQIEVLSG